MKTLIVIPARYGSTRFPGKPLAKIAGKEMLLRVWENAQKAASKFEGCQAVVATDDERIMDFCRSRGIDAVMTSVNCPTGTDRVIEAAEKMREMPEFVVNLQGDNPLCPPWFIEQLIEAWKNDKEGQVFTPSLHLSWEEYDRMKESKKICPHFHLPLQSGSSAILKKMNRHYTKERYLELVRKLRAALPDISLTTDIIVGFPGETEEDFLETMEVVKEVQYDSAFTFIYSKRTGTPAAVMENQIPDDVVKDRFDRLLAEVQEISRERCARFEGQTMDVLVEDVSDHDSSLVTGRLTNNLLVHFKGTEDLIGKIVDVHLDECRGFYYMGTMISK